MQKKTYTIGELSTLSGVKVPTIRFYEQIALLEEPPRTSGNRREYNDEALERLRFIRHSRDLGFETADIRELIALAAHPSSSCHKADTIALRHLQSVEKRIAQLTSLRKELRHMLSQCEHGKVRKCQVIRALADHEACLHSDHSAA